MFSVVERAKWDAWNSVKHLSKTEAMQGYVDEIKNIIETMPQDKYVQKLTEILEPYEYITEKTHVNETGDSSHSDSESEILELNTQKKHAMGSSGDEFLLRLPQNGTRWNQWADLSIQSVNTNTNNTDYCENGTKPRIWNGDSVADSSPSCEENKNNASFVSEDEEDDFCDTSDSIADQHVFKNIKNQSAEQQIELSSANDNIYEQSNHVSQETYGNSKSELVEFESMLHRYGGEIPNTHASVPSNSYSANQASGQPNNFRQSRPGSSLSMGYNSRTGGGAGGGGYPPNENYTLSSINQDSNRQILLILLRLQQDTNNVITRLSYLEATVLSLQSNLQMNRIENSIQLNTNNPQQSQQHVKSSAFSQFNSNSSSVSNSDFFGLLFNFLKNIDWKTVGIAFIWPFVIRLAFYVMRKIRLVIQIKRKGRI